MSNKCVMVHHHLRGLPWQDLLEDGVKERVGSITYPRGKASPLYNQAVSPPHHMPMDTLNTLLQTCPRSSMMCNECTSERVQNSTLCWSSNGKQLPHGQRKLGTTTRQAWWQIGVSRSCRSTITIWHIILGWCLNEFYVLWAYVVELWYLFMLLQAYV
jgi:hypothetical protein